MDMVEKVARAIAEAGNGGKWNDENWYKEYQRDLHRVRARAAIEALRNPTVRAAYYPGENLYTTFWPEMIDNILSNANSYPPPDNKPRLVEVSWPRGA